MRSYFFLATGAAIMLGALPAAALKNVSYPEVKVTVSEAYKPDADFQKTPATAAEGTYYRASEGGNLVWYATGLSSREVRNRLSVHSRRSLVGLHILEGLESH